jgi:hypothetical protein
LYILFIFGECLLVVHLLASLVNSIHRNLLRQVAKLPSIVQHTVSVVTVVGGFVVSVIGLVRVITVVGGLVRVVVGGLVVTVVGLVRVVVGGLVVVGGFVVRVVGLVRVVRVVVVGLVRVVRVVVGGLVVVGLVRVVVVGLVRVVVGRLVVVALVRVVVGRLVVIGLVRIVTPGSHAITVTGIFEGVVQRRRSVEIIISLGGVCLIIHLVY